MRITIFSMLDSVPWGGSEVLWHRLAMAARKSGHEVQACIRHFEPAPPPIMELEAAGVKFVKRKASRVRRFLGLFTKKLFNKALDINHPFMNEITSFRPDAIVVSNAATLESFYYTPLYEWLMANDCSLFLVSQWNAESGPPISGVIAERVTNLSKKWNTFYFVARRNLDVFERRMGVDLPATKVINNPVAITGKEVSPWPAGNVLALACVARYECAFKGQHILIDTLRDEAFDRFNFRVDLVGSGPDRDQLQKLIEQYGLQMRVTIKGHVDNIDNLWSNYHALVLSSVSEGTPLVLLEAMVKGRAAVATDVGGCAEWIDNGETGFLAPAPTRESLKIALLQLLSKTRDELKAMGQAAHDRAMRTLDFNPELRILMDIEASRNGEIK
jgi:glycosyltransferase involved in cell wall biosynthesis